MPKPAQVASSSIELWAQQLLNNNSAESPIVFLSRFGLKTPLAIAQFLLSPEGKATTAQIEHELAIEQAIEEEREIELIAHESLKHRLNIALVLDYLNRDVQASKELVALIQEQSKASIDRIHKAAATSAPQKNPIPDDIDTNKLRSDIDKGIKMAESQQEALKENALILLNNLAVLLKQGELLQEKHKVFEEHIHEKHFKDFDKHLPDFVAGKTKNNLIAMAQKLFSSDAEKLHDAINNRIEQDEDPTLLIQEQKAIALQKAILHDMVAVQKGDKYYADEHGTRVESRDDAVLSLNKEDTVIRKSKLSGFAKANHRSILEHGKVYLLKANEDWNIVKNNAELKEKAHQYALESKTEGTREPGDKDPCYFIRKGYQLVQENGKVYLLNPTQDWNIVKNNPEMMQNALDDADASFARAKQELMTVKNIVGYHKEMENKNHAHKVQAAQIAIDNNKNEQTLIGNLLRILNASRANLEAASEQTTPRNTLTPRPAPSSPKITTKPSPKPAPVPLSTQAYKDKLALSKEQFYVLVDTLPRPEQAGARKDIDAAFNKKLQNGASLLPQEQQALLAQLHLFGVSNRASILKVDPPKPGISPFKTSGPNPYDK